MLSSTLIKQINRFSTNRKYRLSKSISFLRNKNPSFPEESGKCEWFGCYQPLFFSRLKSEFCRWNLKSKQSFSKNSKHITCPNNSPSATRSSYYEHFLNWDQQCEEFFAATISVFEFGPKEQINYFPCLQKVNYLVLFLF